MKYCINIIQYCAWLRKNINLSLEYAIIEVEMKSMIFEQHFSYTRVR